MLYIFQAPACLLSMLSPDTDTDLLIRWTTILANVIQTVKDRGLTATSLPHEYKAPSPETTYTALYGHVTLQKLKSRVFVLCRHSNTDIRHQASRIHHCLTWWVPGLLWYTYCVVWQDAFLYFLHIKESYLLSTWLVNVYWFLYSMLLSISE